MHYQNGREAKNGDKVVDLNTGMSGILHSAVGSCDTCNGRIAQITTGDAYVNIKDCVALEDVQNGASLLPATAAYNTTGVVTASS